MNGEDIVEEARHWLGTPFHHQARLKGHGVDCVGLLVGVATALGIRHRDRRDYSRIPDGVSLEAELDAQLDPVALDAVQPGDVLMFRMPKLPRHVAIFAGETIIHATSDAGRVVEVNFDAYWQRALKKAYRFRGLVEWTQ